jgi:serine/threonine protein kinase
MQSNYVVKLIDVTTTASSYYLLLELCNGGNLETLRKQRNGYLPEKEARVII